MLYMCEIHAAWPTDRITLYVEGGEEPLQVVGIEGNIANKGVVDDEGDKGVLGDVVGELNELMCYDWMNDGLEGVDFTDDIFGGCIDIRAA